MGNPLPSHMYRDPAEVLERKQEAELRKSCTGCAHEFLMKFNKGEAFGCDKGKRHGKRCNLFERAKICSVMQKEP